MGPFIKVVGDHFFGLQHFSKCSGVKKTRFKAEKNFIPYFLLLTKHQNNKLFFHSMPFGVLTGCQTGTICVLKDDT